MKKIILLGLLTIIGISAQTIPQALVGRGFEPNGAYKFEARSGPLKIEYSTNLTTWTPLLTGTDMVTDTSSTNAEWRFYRARTASGFVSNVIGFVRITLNPGKVAVLASPFEADLHLDRPAARKIIFGSESPMVQVYVTKNGKQSVYTWDDLSNDWTPQAPIIHRGTGFMVRNNGKKPLEITFAGELAQGVLKKPVPQGETMIAPLVPKPAPLHDAVGAVGVDGAELQTWDEEKQAYQTSKFNKQTGHWEPPLQYRPGRAVVVKYPESKGQELNFTARFSGTH